MPPHPNSSNISRRKGFWRPATGVWTLVVIVLLGWVYTFVIGIDHTSFAQSDAVANPHTQKPTADKTASKKVNLHAVAISIPKGPPVALVPDPLDSNKQIAVSCTTCHATRKPNDKNVTAKDLDEFHTGLNMKHGFFSCLSCHNPKDYDTLKKADGSPITYPNVMQLCGQCHQSRYNDYQHGAHGGMKGYWDLSKGPRTRKSCIDCHDPHAPAMAKMLPQFKPLDRFMDAPQSKAHPTQASH